MQISFCVHVESSTEAFRYRSVSKPIYFDTARTVLIAELNATKGGVNFIGVNFIKFTARPRRWVEGADVDAQFLLAYYNMTHLLVLTLHYSRSTKDIRTYLAGI